jgi:hypothetical protein
MRMATSGRALAWASSRSADRLGSSVPAWGGEPVDLAQHHRAIGHDAEQQIGREEISRDEPHVKDEGNGAAHGGHKVECGCPAAAAAHMDQREQRRHHQGGNPAPVARRPFAQCLRANGMKIHPGTSPGPRCGGCHCIRPRSAQIVLAAHASMGTVLSITSIMLTVGIVVIPDRPVGAIEVCGGAINASDVGRNRVQLLACDVQRIREFSRQCERLCPTIENRHANHGAECRMGGGCHLRSPVKAFD